jgi:RNA-binding protein NOB1
MEEDKALIGTLILDAGPIISNTTLPKATHYITTPHVFRELKDEAARLRLLSLTEGRLEQRQPTALSLAFVRQFAQKTGDAEVLSGPDLGILALTYELECELNGGDWRLRREPGQARINGKPPAKEEAEESAASIEASRDDDCAPERTTESATTQETETVMQRLENVNITEEEVTQAEDAATHNTPAPVEARSSNESALDDDGWITPSNIKKHQAQDVSADTTQETRHMKVACASHDFALQNVLLQIGLNLVSGNGSRIRQVKTYVLRCHACFHITRKMTLRFCPSCGGATLMRTSTSVDASGKRQIHLKRNMQWNNRGTVYAIPAQQHGTANMKGRENLILRADQREVEKIEKANRYRKTVDLLDDDYLPGIVSGRRETGMHGMKVGHGKRNINSNRKR